MNDIVDTGPIALPFVDVELTALINQLPTPFGQITADGMFGPEPLVSQYFEIDIENDVITALPVTDGGPATVARHGSKEARIFRIPSIEHLNDVRAGDIRGMVALAARSRNQPETLANLMNRRLLNFKRKFGLTWEVMRMSALKGVIVDGAGNTIVDLNDAFGLTPKVVYFDLSDSSADVNESCDLLYQLISEDLSDEVMTGIEVRVSRSFFNQLIAHGSVQKYWLQAEQALALANIARGTDGGYRPRQFSFANVTFIEYSAVYTQWGGSPTPIIAAGLGHAYPVGTMDTHVSYVAPPEDIRVLDGSPADITDVIHITTEPMKHGKGVEMLGQMNVLPFWRRPKLLVEVNAGSGSSTATIGGG